MRLAPTAAGETLDTTADTMGRFVFPAVRPGEYVLSASADGFGAGEVRFIVEPRDVRSVVVALEVGRLAVSVNVRGETPLPSTHSPSSTVLTIERLDQMPVMQRTTLPDALVTLAPGMVRGHDDFVHIRGHEVALNATINGVSQAIHDRGRAGHLFVQLDGDFGTRGALRATVMGDGANFEIPKTPLDLELRPLASAEQRTRQQTSILGWSRAWAGALVSASAYERWSRSRLFPAHGPLAAQADLERELLTVGGKADVTRSAGRHILKAGVDVVRLRPREDLTYRYAGYRDFTHLLGLPHIHVAGQTIAFNERDAGGQASAYVQDAVHLGTRITADLGLRVDHYSLVASATHASPRANVAIEAGRAAIVHASYNRFFVPPPVEGVLSNSAGLTRSIQEIAMGLPAVAPTIEDQFELGIAGSVRAIQVAVTGYFRSTDNPVHTTVWPDSRIYSYAGFDRARAYGLEVKADTRGLVRYGITAYANYALGRVYFYNPVTGGFVTEAAHLTETHRFLAPMDQTHSLTGGLTYRHAGTGLWAGTAVEYGSGTPIEHGHAEDTHAEGDADHSHVSSGERAARVPGHVTADLSFGIDVLRAGNRRPRLTLQLDVQNVANNLYLIARESEFSPAQYSIPRLVSATARIRF